MGHATLIVQMLAVFLAAPVLFNYFIYFVMKHSQTWVDDLKWWSLFSLPLIVMHTFMSQTWLSCRACGISPWVVSIVSTVCGSAGTAFVLYNCYEQAPSAGKVVGFCMMVCGGLVAAYWK